MLVSKLNCYHRPAQSVGDNAAAYASFPIRHSDIHIVHKIFKTLIEIE